MKEKKNKTIKKPYDSNKLEWEDGIRKNVIESRLNVSNSANEKKKQNMAIAVYGSAEKLYVLGNITRTHSPQTQI